MRDIVITEKNNMYQFGDFDANRLPMHHYYWSKQSGCCICSRQVDVEYLYILDHLKSAGLLPNNYKAICCICYIAAFYPDNINTVCEMNIEGDRFYSISFTNINITPEYRLAINKRSFDQLCDQNCEVAIRIRENIKCRKAIVEKEFL